MADKPNIEYIKGGFKVGRKTYRYRINGEPARSVTEILDHTFGAGKFGAGAWWGQKVACESLATLVQQGFDVPWEDPTAVIDLLKQQKATVNHVRDAAGDRGNAVHEAADLYAKTGELPNPDAYPAEQRGYVRSLVEFIEQFDPQFEDTEVVVGSAVHGYAGTYDARATILGKTGLLDYKTSSKVQPAHLFQLAAYELASIECGYPPTDFRAVIHLSPDGEFLPRHYVESKVTAQQWIAQLRAYKAQVEAS